MDAPIILIGPMSTGKTTIAGLLAQRLGIAHHELDNLRWDYYNEIGYDRELGARIRADGGFLALYRYWKPFEIHAVERVLADCRDGVISFGAGHSVYEDEPMFERARRALAPYQHVFLVLPCAGVDEAAAILQARLSAQAGARGGELSPETISMNDHFLRHPSNLGLAKQVVYTEGRTPEETCVEIAMRLRKAAPDGGIDTAACNGSSRA